jgi:hypothetical protein
MATQFETETYEFPDEKEAKGKPVEDKFEVEIEDDTPPQDRGRKPMKEPVEEVTDDELSNYDEKVQQRIKKFTRGYHDERRAKEQALREREAAEMFARQVHEENKRLKQQVATGSNAFIEQSKSAAQTELMSAKDRYKKAYEAGDSDALVAAQEEIARATLKIDRAVNMRPVQVREEEDFAPPPRAPEPPKLAPRTQRWVEANSDWWGVDEEMTSAAMGLDKKLQREYGVDYIGSDDYFRTIDKTMRKRFPEHFVQSHEDDDPPPKKRTSEPEDEDYETPSRATRTTSPVAPAARSTPPNRVRLKASEAAIARRLGVPIEEYAKQVAQLKRNA